MDKAMVRAAFLKNAGPFIKRQYLKKWYRNRTGDNLNLDDPRTYNEKIQWLKLYGGSPLRTQLADKYLVRQYVSDQIGDCHLIPLLGVWENADDIEFSDLPNSFVLKTNHGAGWNILVPDKDEIDCREVRGKLNSWLRIDYAYQNGLELQYEGIAPLILAEPFLRNLPGDLYDYKFFCFDGHVDSIMYLSDRQNGLKMAFFDRNWKKLPFVYTYERNEKEIPRPKTLEKAILLAEKLAKGFPHVRVDFYLIEDEILFGEMTFTSFSGICNWDPPEQNLLFGKKIMLPTDAQ